MVSIKKNVHFQEFVNINEKFAFKEKIPSLRKLVMHLYKENMLAKSKYHNPTVDATYAVRIYKDYLQSKNALAIITIAENIANVSYSCLNWSNKYESHKTCNELYNPFKCKCNQPCLTKVRLPDISPTVFHQCWCCRRTQRSSQFSQKTVQKKRKIPFVNIAIVKVYLNRN